MKGTTIDAVNILNVPVHLITMDQTIAWVEGAMAHHHTYQIATVNPEFVMTAQQDPDFLTILQSADLCLPDGIGLVWASRLLKKPLPERVPGSDLVYRLAQACADHGWRLFLLGAAPGVAEEAAAVLKNLYPALMIAGTFAGSPDPREDQALVERINQSEADMLFVAYGAPRQDKWINRNRNRLTTIHLAIGVGGSLDFITGRSVRAPRWIQNLGLEWLHRLFKEPWRWRRMLALPQFAWKIIKLVQNS
ncbi:MAG: WecB/TagA/CpsF family glycosyltransferase [Ardenticatenaceae bacterium]|nr:WecB/TagA/CpsF family glycosyltransferase [Ardenticatenaceae bacterium]